MKYLKQLSLSKVAVSSGIKAKKKNLKTFQNNVMLVQLQGIILQLSDCSFKKFRYVKIVLLFVFDYLLKIILYMNVFNLQKVYTF